MNDSKERGPVLNVGEEGGSEMETSPVSKAVAIYYEEVWNGCNKWNVDLQMDYKGKIGFNASNILMVALDKISENGCNDWNIELL